MKTYVEDVDNEIKNGLLGGKREQEEAIRMAYERYKRPLFSFIHERVAPTLDSDEIATAVNNVFIGLAKYAARRRFRANGALSTLLFAMARRKAIDQLRRKPKLPHDTECDGAGHGETYEDEVSDDEFETRINRYLVMAPEIHAVWRTAVDEMHADEVFRAFRLLIGRLPRLQRKVAEALLKNPGCTCGEICDRLAETGPRPSEASVKSARREIAEKFEQLLKSQER